MARLGRPLSSLAEPHPAWRLREDRERPELRPDDVFLVSYPRSGNTWVRAIVAYLLFPPERIGSLSDLNQLVPDIHKGLPPRPADGSLRVVKSHRAYAYRHRRDDARLYGRVVYLVRHPFDVIRSLHHYDQQSRPRQTLRETLEKTVLGWSEWGSWQDHVLSWKAEERRRQVLFLRFEDFRGDFVATTARLARFLVPDAPPAPGVIESVRRHTSREAMVELERRGWIKPQESEFIRRTEARRELDDNLDAAQRRWVSESFGEAMGLFGYTEHAA